VKAPRPAPAPAPSPAPRRPWGRWHRRVEAASTSASTAVAGTTASLRSLPQLLPRQEPPPPLTADALLQHDRTMARRSASLAGAVSPAHLPRPASARRRVSLPPCPVACDLPAASVDRASLALTPVTPARSQRTGRLVLLLGARPAPLATLAVRLASEALAAESASSAGLQPASSLSAAPPPPLLFAFICTSDFADGDLVARIRAASPSLIMLCADASRPSTFEALVKTDLTLCGTFGRAAPRVWVLVRGADPPRGTGVRSRGVDAHDVAAAAHYLALGPHHVRTTLYVRLGAGVRDLRKLFRRLEECVSAGVRAGSVAGLGASASAQLRHDVQVPRVRPPLAPLVFTSCVRACSGGN
jgi:hypothetical protein